MGDWVVTLIGKLGYAGIALLMFAETVFPPIPSEVIMPLAGMQAARGPMSIVGVILAGSAGAMLGNVLWFAIARALGLDRFRAFIGRHGRWLTIEWRDVERGRDAMERRGRWFVCLGRLIPTVRSIVSIPAGLLRMRWVGFLLWSAVGTVAWTSLLTIAGAYLGQRFGMVERVVSPIATGVIAVLAVAYAWRVARRPRRRD
jgi:membrane protein DedA with SNARE-associated domain